MANNLVKVPADHLVRNLQTVLHALASRAQDNVAGLRRAYLTVLGGVGVIAFPTFTFVALMAEPVVSTLLGPKWSAAASVLVPLSLAMVLHAAEAMAGPTLSGRGEPSVELRVKLIMFVLSLPVLALTARWSLTAVGWGVALVYLARWLWMSAAVSKRLGISAGQFAQAMTGSFLLAGVSWAVPRTTISVLAALDMHWPSGGLLALGAALTALAILAVTSVVPQIVLGPYLLALMNGLFENRPAWAGRFGLRRLAARAALAAKDVATHHTGVPTPWTRRPKTF